MRKTKSLATIFILLAAATVVGATLLSQREVSGRERVIRGPRAISSVINLFDEGGWLGVQLEDVTAENMNQYKLSTEAGAIVKEVEKDSPAERAGLREKDVIVSYAGQPVISVSQFARLIRETPPGRTVALGTLRDGVQQTLQAKIEERSHDRIFRHTEILTEKQMEMARRAQEDAARALGGFYNRPLLGVEVQGLTDQMAEFFGAKAGGVLITYVKDGSPAAKAGLKAGDVITAADDKTIGDTQDLYRALRKKSDGGQVTLKIIRDKNPMTVTVQLEEMKKPERSRTVRRSIRL